MKKELMIVLMVAVYSIGVFAEPIVTMEKMHWWNHFFAPKYISGGSLIDADTINKGEIISAEVELKFSMDAQCKNDKGVVQKLELYFVDESNTQYNKLIGTFYFSKTNKVTDWVKVTVDNVDTGILDKNWCGKGIKISGKHYAYQGNCGFPEGSGGVSWVPQQRKEFSDYTYDFYARDITGGHFQLICSDTPNNCVSKSLGFFCDSSKIRYEKVQTTFVMGDGKCKEEQNKVPCPAGTVCTGNGICVAGKICEPDEKKCSGTFSLKCTSGGYWSMAEGDATACFSGKCEASTGECVEDSDVETGDNASEVASTTGGDKECISCSTDKLCPDGKTVYAKCINKCYSSDVKACPTGKVTNSKGEVIDEGNDEGKGIMEIYEDFSSTQKWVIGGLGVALLGLVGFVIYKKKSGGSAKFI